MELAVFEWAESIKGVRLDKRDMPLADMARLSKINIGAPGFVRVAGCGGP